MLRLVTIPISHYCEKARWTLDRAGLDYVEEPHVQALHRFYARRAGGGPTVPVLVTPQGAIGDSAEIVAWVDERVEPERRLLGDTPGERAEAEALCRRFDEGLGPAGRRLIYVHMFAQGKATTLAFNNQGVPRWEDRALRIGWPLATRLVGRVLAIEPGVEIEDERLVWSEFDHVAELLSDGREYLLGGRFGAADLTFASLAAPMIVPPIYGVRLPQPDEMDAATADLVKRAREHPAGRWAMELIKRHRRATDGYSAVPL
jgi:glutathione S-transferase